MTNKHCEGIGSISRGTYDTVQLEGMFKLKAPAKIKTLLVEGTFKSKGALVVEEFKMEGIARIFRPIKAKHIHIEGLLKLRRASVNVNNMYCEGILVSNKEISVDEFHCEGICAVNRILGDKITLTYKQLEQSTKISTFPIKGIFFTRLYFGKPVDFTQSLIDQIECTELIAEKLICKTVYANSVKLSNHCVIDQLHCDGSIEYDNTCIIHKVIKKV